MHQNTCSFCDLIHIKKNLATAYDQIPVWCYKHLEKKQKLFKRSGICSSSTEEVEQIAISTGS